MSVKKKFAIGAEVRVKNPGVAGVVRHVDDEPTVLGEYWHKVETKHGERHEPGCNLEFMPKTEEVMLRVAVRDEAGQGFHQVSGRSRTLPMWVRPRSSFSS